MSQIISANWLSDGRVVYLMADGGWSRTSHEAARYHDKAELAEGLALAQRDEAANLVLDLTPVMLTADGTAPRAATLRDRIRLQGPTVAYGRAAFAFSRAA